MEKQKGIVVYVNLRKAYGFIQNCEGEELFFHISGLLNPTKIEELKAGQVVEYFKIKERLGRQRAVGVAAV